MAFQCIVALASSLQHNAVAPACQIREIRDNRLNMHRHTPAHDPSAGSYNSQEEVMEVMEAGAYDIEDLSFDKYDTALLCRQTGPQPLGHIHL